MLSQELAERFIQKLAVYTPYNVNIMDQSGRIIASKDRERVGTIHEIAYDIIRSNRDILEVDEAGGLLGVRAGVNMAVRLKNQVVGVIGITGKVSDVRPIAQVMRASFETMLEYEAEKEKKVQQLGQRKEFIQKLLYENAGAAELKEAARQLGYQTGVSRVLILIVPGGGEADELCRRLESLSGSVQDIAVVTPQRHVVLCTAVSGCANHLDCGYREEVRDFLARLGRNGLFRRHQILVGLPVKHLSHYRQSYLHCLWLSRQTVGKSGTVFFEDHLDSYLKSCIPIVELHKIFNSYAEDQSEEFLCQFVSTINALRRNNYNMGQASQTLSIHKNTLAFRLQKIKDAFHMNPMQDMRDRAFMEYMAFYLENRQ